MLQGSTEGLCRATAFRSSCAILGVCNIGWGVGGSKGGVKFAVGICW